MPHDDLFDHHPTNGGDPADHGTGGGESILHTEPGTGVNFAGAIPMAEEVFEDNGLGGGVAVTPNPIAAGLPPGFPGLSPSISPQLPHVCNLNLPEGCYRLTYKPKMGLVEYRGTLRVDRHTANPVISGDLYRFLAIPSLLAEAPVSARLLRKARDSARSEDESPSTSSAVTPLAVAKAAGLSLFARSLGIPIYPRNKYHSYLKGIGLTIPKLSFGQCSITISLQEYIYTQPAPGSFNGTFPAAPGTRTIQLVLHSLGAPIGFPGEYFEGRLLEGGVDKGHVSLGWVSKYFRKATVEIDTVAGAVAPQPVPALSGPGTESIRTVYATAGWDVNAVYDQKNIPVPAGVVGTNCWSNADLHALMLSVRNPATNLDAEWRMHLVVVQAQLGCGRGVMYDQIGVPREGVASFCDDGYPAAESPNFGTASGLRQRNVARAFLRSACHETAHGFNQIHQEQEGGADNSIMTTTPSVANVLGGPVTGEPGVFPDNINLGFNEHVRHHLVHFPDPTVRPGGMTFGSGHSSTVPQADRTFFAASELALTLSVEEDRIELGEPLRLSWKLTNVSDEPIPVPSDIGIAAQHTFLTVIDSHGVSRPMPSFEIRTDDVTIIALEPDMSVEAKTRLFWSSRGFAFETPGRYTVQANVIWSIAGIPVGVQSSTDVWVNFPQTRVDNDAAADLLHPEVGKYVALGGGADHLTEAVARLERVMGMIQGEEGAGADFAEAREARGAGGGRAKALRGYRGLRMPVAGAARTDARRGVHAPDRPTAVGRGATGVGAGAPSDAERRGGGSGPRGASRGKPSRTTKTR